jgi:hypothetical protein
LGHGLLHELEPELGDALLEGRLARLDDHDRPLAAGAPGQRVGHRLLVGRGLVAIEMALLPAVVGRLGQRDLEGPVGAGAPRRPTGRQRRCGVGRLHVDDGEMAVALRRLEQPQRGAFGEAPVRGRGEAGAGRGGCGGVGRQMLLRARGSASSAGIDETGTQSNRDGRCGAWRSSRRSNDARRHLQP